MNNKEKKQSDLSALLGYAGNYKGLTFLGLALSAVAMILGMVPYVLIWLVSRDLIEVAPNWTEGIDRTLPTMITVIGVFQYFREEQVRAFIEDVKNHFDEMELLFDAMTMKVINYAANYIKKTGNNDAMLYFGTDSPEEFVSSMDYELIEVRPFFTDARKQLKKELKLYTRIAMKVVDEGGRRGFLVHCRKPRP